MACHQAVVMPALSRHSSRYIDTFTHYHQQNSVDYCRAMDGFSCVCHPVSHAGTPASSQPYTCYVCSATATSRKNYIAHLQVSAVSLLFVQLHCNQQDNLHCPLESQIHLLQLHLIIG